MIYAGKPGFLSNPFERRWIRKGTLAFGHALAFKLHRRWLLGEIAALSLERLGFSPAEIDALARKRARILRSLPALRGRDLECWCPLTCAFCHVDTIIELAALSLDRGLTAAQ